METEAGKFGIDAAISRNGDDPRRVTVTNYERLEHFDRDKFGGVVCDEARAIKAYRRVRRAMVTEFLRKMPYRLLATATAAPNDYTELGTSSEALGYLGYMDMLGRFFTNKDKTSQSWAGSGVPGAGEEWRFKGHAEDPFWRWVSSWARAMRKPSDLGFSDDGFDPAAAGVPGSHRRGGPARRRRRALFDVPAIGLPEEREEPRRTITERCEKAAELLADAEPGIAWCHLNDEGDLLDQADPRRGPGGRVRLTADVKEETAGRVRPRGDPGAGHEAVDRRVGPELAALPPDDVLRLDHSLRGSTTRRCAAAGGSASSTR